MHTIPVCVDALTDYTRRKDKYDSQAHRSPGHNCLHDTSATGSVKHLKK